MSEIWTIFCARNDQINWKRTMGEMRYHRILKIVGGIGEIFLEQLF